MENKFAESYVKGKGITAFFYRDKVLKKLKSYF